MLQVGFCNKFRYDTITNQYIYNLAINSMSAGMWRVKAILNDGETYEVDVSVRK